MEKMVTRTIATTKVKVLGIKLSDSTATVQEITLGGKGYTEKDAFKAVSKKTYEDFIPAKVTEMVEDEKLYGMTEAEFLAHAKELPPRTTNSAE